MGTNPLFDYLARVFQPIQPENENPNPGSQSPRELDRPGRPTQPIEATGDLEAALNFFSPLNNSWGVGRALPRSGPEPSLGPAGRNYVFGGGRDQNVERASQQVTDALATSPTLQPTPGLSEARSSAIGRVEQRAAERERQNIINGGGEVFSPEMQALFRVIQDRRFEDTWDDPENGLYTTYGHQQFQPGRDHPRIYFGGPDGRTSPSGPFQIVARTWDSIAPKLGLDNFGDRNQQERAAAYLARQAYQRQFRRDLDTDLRDPQRWNDISRAISAEWASLPYGVQRRGTQQDFETILRQALAERAGGARTFNEFAGLDQSTRSRRTVPDFVLGENRAGRSSHRAGTSNTRAQYRERGQ